MMPKKLLFSLSLTPLTDRFISTIFGVTLTVAKTQFQEQDDIYAFGEEDEINPDSAEVKKKSVIQLILIFKSTMVVVMYIFSTYTKSYREKHVTVDNEEGLSKVIDSMIKKIVWIMNLR